MKNLYRSNQFVLPAALICTALAAVLALGSAGLFDKSGGAKTDAQAPSAVNGTASPAAASAADVTVYVTETGRRYHRESCSSLGKSKIPVSLKDAAAQGYDACGVCNPPTLDSGGSVNESGTASVTAGTAKSVQQDSGLLYRVNIAGVSSYRQADLSKMLPAVVEHCADGDTVRVRIANPPPELDEVETLRLLGVDTPETKHPNKPVQYFGMEASGFTKKRLDGKKVLLAFDWDLRDHYGRALVYVYLPDGSCHNADLIAEGYGYAYTRFPIQFLDEFRRLEQDARREKRGLWGKEQ